MQTNNQLENLITEQISVPHQEHFSNLGSSHPPRILLLYGSLRQRSFSRLVVLLKHMGAEVRIFNPEGLPQPDTADESHPKVQELRDLMVWSEGQVWCMVR